MWTVDADTTVSYLVDGTVIDYDRAASALTSAIDGNYGAGNVFVIDAVIDAFFGASATVHTEPDWLTKHDVTRAWANVVNNRAGIGDYDLMWRLMFRAFGRSRR